MDARAAAPVDQEVVEQVADEIARRLRDGNARQVELEAVAQQIDAINGRIDAMTATRARADEPEPVMRELLERLREAGRANDSLAAESSAAVNAALSAHLAELRSEQAGADQRTQSRLADLQGILEMLAARLASIESELTIDDIDEELRPPAQIGDPGPADRLRIAGRRRRDPKPRRNAQAKPGRRAPTIRRLSRPMTAKTSSSSPARARRSAPAKLVSSHRLLGLRPIPR